jgi:signal transduction histidine kinase
VDDLLVLTRLHGPPAGRRARVLDLDDLVLAEAAAARPRPRIRIDLSAVSAAQLSGDRAMLDRVVRNLLDNAVRHARSAVLVSLAARDGVAELTVADDGPGVPPPDREAVFERFTRLDEARARDAGGVGLGLAIVRDVVAVTAGTVTVEDAEPGARFVVRLPR